MHTEEEGLDSFYQRSPHSVAPHTQQQQRRQRQQQQIAGAINDEGANRQADGPLPMSSGADGHALWSERTSGLCSNISVCVRLSMRDLQWRVGVSSSEEHILSKPPFEIHRTERGGEVTYHGPGQVVVYPILDLTQHRKDLHWYLRQMEGAVIDALATYGVRAHRDDAGTGVWVGDGKIAAVGLSASRWVTMHGLALNVDAVNAMTANSVPMSTMRAKVSCFISNFGPLRTIA